MKTKKLLKTLIKSQKYRIQQLRDNNQIQVTDLARKIQSVHADRETWILRHNTLESQNKALQSDLEVQKALVKTFELSVLSISDYNGKLREENKSLQEEKENLGAANRLHLMKIERLQSVVDSFNSLKSEMDK